MKKNRSKTGLAVFIAIGECALSKDNELGRLGQSHPIGAITTNWQAAPVKVDDSHKIQVVKLVNQCLYYLILKNFQETALESHLPQAGMDCKGLGKTGKIIFQKSVSP
ncbi:hypothetical protein [uncultured Bartonella sp.]|uniref:hypothetical protein n=1 Tax=uncultured Bartonella sp. TaxID=104108 RepID=UPI0025D9E12A|nr:hypothetical protein [uncultured Bartonella sp.]